MTHNDACLVLFNKKWGIPHRLALRGILRLCVGLYIFPTIVAGMRRQLIEKIGRRTSTRTLDSLIKS